ncbi:alpha-amylase family glycosyl hydrolase [Arthrobacter sp. AL08]|uniref:alpha-amylase family glycosyl hydrolase n=1 Tax=unclassified Arthrobacter TaxID=235627 RepID=UPI00249A29B9|nr:MULTISPECIES: alpha-amylase family glycosyl hydrolase [unclassified Arthrobacter]MDI3242731.1 alpha-amylase family glycosyl hydrolase [Arthrobacter sp. AL05]MDI3278742.1 alpha-amylase family glycosyl hydrolase [Arthrobacter sp. AL08]
MSEPTWVQHAIWWQVYPLGFTGADAAAGTAAEPVVHRLDRLHAWLDYAVELGASGLALGPVFASESHGYDTTDYYRIDPRLGDDNDFDELVAQAHARGLKVLLDGVFNHTGRSFGPFRQVLADGPAAPTGSWFRLDWPDDGWAPGVEPGYKDFEGHHHLVALNHEEPQVAEFVADVMKHWLGRGADGWRLDAAYAVPPSFWKPVLAQVRRDYPDAYFVGEYIHGDYAHEVQASTLDAVTQYELWKAVWSSLNDGNFYELAAALERHNGFLATFTPLTFVGNHDVTRLASRLTDPEQLPLALAVLLTVGGTPSIYYGDEQAFRGVKEDRAGGDDAVRPAFPGTPAELAGLGWPVYHLHQELISLRRRHAWLHSARTRVLTISNEHLVYEASGDGGSLTVALNLSGAPVEVSVPASAAALLAGRGGKHPDRGSLTLDGYGWAVLGDTD